MMTIYFSKYKYKEKYLLCLARNYKYIYLINCITKKKFYLNKKKVIGKDDNNIFFPKITLLKKHVYSIFFIIFL